MKQFPQHHHHHRLEDDGNGNGVMPHRRRQQRHKSATGRRRTLLTSIKNNREWWSGPTVVLFTTFLIEFAIFGSSSIAYAVHLNLANLKIHRHGHGGAILDDKMKLLSGEPPSWTLKSPIYVDLSTLTTTTFGGSSYSKGSSSYSVQSERRMSTSDESSLSHFSTRSESYLSPSSQGFSYETNTPTSLQTSSSSPSSFGTVTPKSGRTFFGDAEDTNTPPSLLSNVMSREDSRESQHSSLLFQTNNGEEERDGDDDVPGLEFETLLNDGEHSIQNSEQVIRDADDDVPSLCGGSQHATTNRDENENEWESDFSNYDDPTLAPSLILAAASTKYSADIDDEGEEDIISRKVPNAYASFQDSFGVLDENDVIEERQEHDGKVAEDLLPFYRDGNPAEDLDDQSEDEDIMSTTLGLPLLRQVTEVEDDAEELKEEVVEFSPPQTPTSSTRRTPPPVTEVAIARRKEGGGGEDAASSSSTVSSLTQVNLQANAAPCPPIPRVIVVWHESNVPPLPLNVKPKKSLLQKLRLARPPPPPPKALTTTRIFI